jgi:multiple sugar transport system substrate-binding protein
MNRVQRWVFGIAVAAFATLATAQQTTLRIFTGGQQRPDVMRKTADEYQ